MATLDKRKEEEEEEPKSALERAKERERARQEEQRYDDYVSAGTSALDRAKRRQTVSEYKESGWKQLSDAMDAYDSVARPYYDDYMSHFRDKVGYSDDVYNRAKSAVPKIKEAESAASSLLDRYGALLSEEDRKGLTDYLASTRESLSNMDKDYDTEMASSHVTGALEKYDAAIKPYFQSYLDYYNDLYGEDKEAKAPKNYDGAFSARYETARQDLTAIQQAEDEVKSVLEKYKGYLPQENLDAITEYLKSTYQNKLAVSDFYGDMKDYWGYFANEEDFKSKTWDPSSYDIEAAKREKAQVESEKQQYLSQFIDPYVKSDSKNPADQDMTAERLLAAQRAAELRDNPVSLQTRVNPYTGKVEYVRNDLSDFAESNYQHTQEYADKDVLGKYDEKAAKIQGKITVAEQWQKAAAIEADVTARADYKQYVPDAGVNTYGLEPVQYAKVNSTQMYGQNSEYIPYMTDEEFSILKYIDQHEGREKAEEYLGYKAEELTDRIAQRIYDDVLKDRPALQTLYGIVAGTDQWMQGLRYATNFSNDYIAPSPAAKANSLAVQALHDNASVSILGKGGLEAVNNILTTTANMVPMFATSLAMPAAAPAVVKAVLPAVVMGTGAYGHARQEMINAGYDAPTATVYGLMNGIMETTLQATIGAVAGSAGLWLDNLEAGALNGLTKLENAVARASSKIGTSAFARAFDVAARSGIKIATEALGEGIEESLQEFFDPYIKRFVTGDYFEDATAEEVFYAGLLGALSSVGMGAVPAARYVYKSEQAGYRAMSDPEALSALAEEIMAKKAVAGKTEAGQLAVELAEQVAEGASLYDIGRFIYAADAFITKYDSEQIQNYMVENFGHRPQDAEKLANVLVAVAGGMELSPEQQEMLNVNDYAKLAAYMALIEDHTSVAQREKVLNKVLDTQRSNKDLNTPRKALASERKSGWAEYLDRAKAGKIVDEERVQSVRSADKKTTPAIREVSGIKGEYKTGGKVTAEDVTFVKDGKVKVNGQVVDAQTLRYADRNTADVVEALQNSELNAAEKQMLLDQYDGKTAPVSYILGSRELYRLGKLGEDIDTAGYGNQRIGTLQFGNLLNDVQRNTAYRLGVEAAKRTVETDQANIQRKIEKAKRSAKGQVVDLTKNGIEYDKLNDRQKVAYDLVDVLEKASGTVWALYRSSDGTMKAKNGAYVDGVFYIDLDSSLPAWIAGEEGARNAMTYTISHEWTHFMQQWAPAKYDTFKRFLFKNYAEKGVSVEDLAMKHVADALAAGDNLTMEKAFDEVVAESCERFLMDTDAVEKIAELRAEDGEIYTALKNKVVGLRKRAKDAYDKMDPLSPEAELFAKYVDQTEKLYDMWVEGSVEAAQSYKQGGKTYTQKMLNENIEKVFSAAKDQNGDALFQYKAIQADEAEYRKMLNKYKKAIGFTDADIEYLFDTIHKVTDMVEVHKEILDFGYDEDLVDEKGNDTRSFLPVKKNSDPLYKVSLDFSTLCRKRLMLQTIIETLQDALSNEDAVYVMSKEEQVAINEELRKLRDEGARIEVACALCYVEAARMKNPDQIRKFFLAPENVVKAYLANRDPQTKVKIAEAERQARIALGKKNHTTIYTERVGNAYKLKIGDMSEMDANEIRAAKKEVQDTYVGTEEDQKHYAVAKAMTINDVSADGLKALAKNDPVVYHAFVGYVSAATKSKGVEADTWFRAGDTKRKMADGKASLTATDIKNMNAENGVRTQSWSDFQIIHLLDYMASTIEMSVRGAKMHGYTKFEDYVYLMGRTGVMINLSLIPKIVNGEVTFDDIEGMDYKTAMKLRDLFPETAGTIIIGIDDNQIRSLMENLDIDYIIPYHRSGNSAALREELGIGDWDEYQDIQSEEKIDLERSLQTKDYHKKIKFSDWFDLEEARKIAARENETPSRPDLAKKYGKMYGGYMAMAEMAQKYKDLCDERGFGYKFAKFADEQNYWKLLIDRKMINQKTGELIEQKPVKPIFEFETKGGVPGIKDLLQKHLDGYKDSVEEDNKVIKTVITKFLGGEMNERIAGLAKTLNSNFDHDFDILSTANVDKTVLEAQKKKNPAAFKEGVVWQSKVTPEENARYMELAEDPKANEVKLRNMVAVAAYRAGYDVKGYHGTPNGGFTTFAPTITRNGAKNVGVIWFAKSKFHAKNAYEHYVEWGKQAENPMTYETWLNLGRSANIGNGRVEAITYDDNSGKEIASRDLRRVASAITDPSLTGEERVTRRVENAEALLKIAKDIYADFVWQVTETTEFAELCKKNGFDSVIAYEEGKVDDSGKKEMVETYGVFSSTQIKSADPVTYDDDGNVIPLSERFNEKKTDIRWQDKLYFGNGYDGYSMSNNARAAYESGEKPISKWTKADIVDAVAELNPDAADLIAKVSLRTLKDKLLTKTSWHHTSKMFNKTDFYSIDEEVVEGLTKDIVRNWATSKNTMSYGKEFRGDIEYLEWEGTKKHPKPVNKKLTDVNIEQRGSFYIVTDDSGAVLLRKKIGSNGTRVIDYEAERRAQAERESRIEKIKAASTPDAAKLLSKFETESGYEYSSSGNIYARGRKPSRLDYIYGLDKFFSKGEKRLAPNGSGGYYVETWDGTTWQGEKTDIRWQDKQSDNPISDYYYDEYKGAVEQLEGRTVEEPTARERLADAFEGLAKTDAEKDLLAKYRKSIATKNAAEARLKEISGEIRDAEKAKDKQLVAQLRDEKTKLTNNIRTYDSKLLKMEDAKPLREVITREKAKSRETVRKKAAARYDQMLKEQSERYKERLKQKTVEKNEAVEKQKEHDKEVQRRKKERMTMTVVRNKIRDLHEQIMADLQSTKKGKSVPIDMRWKVAELLDAVNMDYIDADERIADLRRELENTSDPDVAAYLQGRIDRLRARDEKRLASEGALREKVDDTLTRSGLIRERLLDLQDQFTTLKGDEETINAYNEVVDNALQALIKIVGNTSIRSMTLEQLNATYNTLKALNHVIKEANTVIGESYAEGLREFGAAMMSELDDNFEEGKIRRVAYRASMGGQRFINTMLRPQSFFEKMAGYAKDSHWRKAYDMLNKGQLRQISLRMKYSEMFAELVNDKKSLNALRQDMVELNRLKDRDGNAITVTRDMMLAIYMHLLNEDNARHLVRGGLKIPDVKLYYKGSEYAYTKSQLYTQGTGGDIERVIKDLNEVEEALAEEETEDLRQRQRELRGELSSILEEETEMIERLKSEIEGRMTDYDRKWVETMQDFFEESALDLNATTEALYGVSKAMVDNYFPIHTDQNFLNVNNEAVKLDASLENAGFMKERVKASNPIMLEGVSEVVNSQIRKTSQYAGMVIPLRNFDRMYGMKTKTNSVQAAMERTYGKPAMTYLDDLIADLNGGRRSKYKALGFLRGNIAGAALTANLSVAMSQAASYEAAAAVVGHKALIKALGTIPKNFHADQDLIAKYSSLLWLRRQGYVDADLGDLTKSGFVSRLRKSDSKAARAFLKFGLGWIQAVDNATVGRLWYAAESYVKDNNKEMDVGSAEYYEAVAKIFNRIVEETQPDYTTLQRPGVLRSNSETIRSLTMFMTQRLQNFNILYDAASRYLKYRKDFKNGGKNGVTAEDVKQARKGLSRAIISQLTSALILVGMKELVKLLLHKNEDWRDDETGEITIGSTIASFADMLANSLVSNVLGGAEAYDAGKAIATGRRYYGIDVNGVSQISDFVSKFVSFAKNVSAKNGKSLAYSVAMLTGVPANNIENMVMAVPRWLEGWEYTEAQDKNRMLQAALAGDEEATRDLREKYGDDYDTMLSGKIRETDEYVKLAARGMMDGYYLHDTAGLAAKYHVSEEMIDDAITKEKTYLTRRITEAANDKNEGDNEGYDKVVNALVDRYEGVYTREEIVKMVDKRASGEDQDSVRIVKAAKDGDEETLAELREQYGDGYDNLMIKGIRAESADLRAETKKWLEDDEVDTGKITRKYNITEDLAEKAIKAEATYVKGRITTAAKNKKAGKTNDYKKVVKDLLSRYDGIYTQDEIVALVNARENEL